MSSSYRSDISKDKQRECKPEINILELTTILVKYVKFIIYAIGIVIALAIIWLLLLPNKYTSTASILPGASTDKINDLKSLVGIGISSIDYDNPTALFPSILESRHVANNVLSGKYSFKLNGRLITLTLQEYFGESDFDKLILQLADISSFNTDKNTNVIQLAVETTYPALSQAIVAKYIIELENYNLYKRSSKAKEKEVYLAKQLSVFKEELSAAEDERERFQAENSNWRISSNSKIIKTLSRLEREVEIKSNIYLFLTQEYERAKFETQKDVPIIQILDNPSLPTQKSGPHRTMILLLILVISLFLVVLMIVMYEALNKQLKEQEKDQIDEIKNNLQKAFPIINKYILRKKNE